MQDKNQTYSGVILSRSLSSAGTVDSAFFLAAKADSSVGTAAILVAALLPLDATS